MSQSVSLSFSFYLSLSLYFSLSPCLAVYLSPSLCLSIFISPSLYPSDLDAFRRQIHYNREKGLKSNELKKHSMQQKNFFQFSAFDYNALNLVLNRNLKPFFSKANLICSMLLNSIELNAKIVSNTINHEYQWICPTIFFILSIRLICVEISIWNKRKCDEKKKQTKTMLRISDMFWVWFKNHKKSNDAKMCAK